MVRRGRWNDVWSVDLGRDWGRGMGIAWGATTGREEMLWWVAGTGISISSVCGVDGRLLQCDQTLCAAQKDEEITV